MKPIYAMLIGAGLKGTVVGFVKQALGTAMGGGLAGISDDMLALGIGYLIKEKAKGDMRDVGTGIFIAGGAGLVEGVVSGMPILGGGAAPAATTTRAPAPIMAPTLEQAAAAL